MLSGINQTSQIASALFSKLDTKSQGYLEASDFVSAFSQIQSGENSSTAEEVFAALDSDSDGKVTESEFSQTLSKLQEELESQFNQMRMEGMAGQGPQGMAGMPPPPPPANDEGFTQDELQSQLEEIGSSDSKRSDLIAKIVENFEAADTDSDGKVSFAEAQAYNQSNATSGDSGSASNTASAANSDAEIMMQIMKLVHAYGNDQGSNTGLSTLLSVSA